MPIDDAYDAVLSELKKLHESWRLHREVVNRAINLLNHEVVSFSQRLDKDDQARELRQADLDAKLLTITDSQTQLRRWQWIRISVEVLAVLTVAAFLYGVSR